MSLGKKTILILSLTKVISTVICATSYTLNDFFLSFTAFTFPFSCAIFYDTELVTNYGKIMVFTLLLLVIMWFLFFLFLIFKKTVVTKISYILFVVVNCFDLVCVVCSLIQSDVTLTKIINLIFTLLIIIVTVLTIVKSNITKGSTSNAKR